MRCLNELMFCRLPDPLPTRWKFICVTALVAVFALTAYFCGFANYHADSWAYYELSRTVFHGGLFKFNFYRTFFSLEYSATFPLGLPVVIAIGNEILRTGPMTGVILNIGIAGISWFVILRIGRQLALSAHFAVALATATVCWWFYLDEIFSACAIPLALLLFLLGATSYLSKHYFLAGCFVGLAAVTRFDNLVHAIVFQLVVLALHHRSLRRSFVIGGGFVTGAAPWVYYSLTHFGRIWASDNSWVALSALPAFVEDFPAVATVAAIDQPTIWLERVFGNIFPLIARMLSAAVRHPVFCAVIVCFLAFSPRMPRADVLRVVVFGAISSMALAPYVLTGYFDHRYFGTFFLAISTAMLWSVQRCPERTIKQQTVAIVNLGLVLALGFACWKLITESRDGVTNWPLETVSLAQIETLSRCHEQKPALTYIFHGESRRIAARYGAITGQRGSILPSNYQRLTPERKRQFLSLLAPYALVSSVTEECPTETQLIP